MSEKFSKYISAFDLFEYKTLLVLSAVVGSVSIASFITVIVASVGIIRESLNLVFSICNEIVKKLLKTITKKTKKNVLVARSKLNSIENIISKELKDN